MLKQNGSRLWKELVGDFFNFDLIVKKEQHHKLKVKREKLKVGKGV